MARCEKRKPSRATSAKPLGLARGPQGPLSRAPRLGTSGAFLRGFFACGAMPRNRAPRMQRGAKTNAARWFRNTRPRNRGPLGGALSANLPVHPPKQKSPPGGYPGGDFYRKFFWYFSYKKSTENLMRTRLLVQVDQAGQVLVTGIGSFLVNRYTYTHARGRRGPDGCNGSRC